MLLAGDLLQVGLEAVLVGLGLAEPLLGRGLLRLQLGGLGLLLGGEVVEEPLGLVGADPCVAGPLERGLRLGLGLLLLDAQGLEERLRATLSALA